MSTKSLMGYFRFSAGSQITAASVVSLPVPAVVGMAASSGVLRRIFSKPPMRCTGRPGRAMQAPAAFAQSITLPPPKATMACAPPD